MVRGPSWRSQSGQGTITKVRKWSRDHPKGPEVVEGPSRRSRIGLGDAPDGPEVVGGPSLRSGNGRGTLP